VSAPLAGKRILLVVEDPVLAELLAEAASRLGAAPRLCPTGRSALDALAEPGPLHAAIIDLPLPDVRGAEVLRAVRGAGIPMVVVSGSFRGPQAAGEVLRAGAAEFYEKPFPILSIMGRLAQLMGQALPGLPEPDDDVTGAIPIGQPLDDGPYLSLTDDDAVAEPPAPLATLADPLPAPPGAATPAPPAQRRAGGPPRQGDLGEASVPRLLVGLHEAQATGALTVQRGPVKKILLLEKGVPLYAASNLAGERLGAVCVRRGVVTAEALQALRHGDPGASTAALLLAAGKLTPARRVELTAAQVRAIAWSTFEWRDGRYDFQLARPPPGLLHLGLSLADLLLEGMVRASTLARLRAELPLDVHLAPAPDPCFELYALGLRPAEAHLLMLCDGTKSAGDLLALARLPEREALAFLQACRVMRVLDEVDRVLSGTRRMGFM
jgi:CheY-like chemotaxis protein